MTTLRRAFVSFVLAAVLALPAAATAAQRYASPAGSGTTCSQPSPCGIVTAINSAAAFDEVILAPGDYGSAMSRIATGLVSFQQGVSIHGTAGQPRPVIWSSASPSMRLAEGGSLEHVRIESSSDDAFQFEGNAVATNIVVHHTGAANVGGRACTIGGTSSTGEIRSSVCWSNNSTAVLSSVNGGVAATIRLRNVTAYAPNAGSYAIDVGAGSGANMSVVATNTIAVGGLGDVRAQTFDAMSTATATLDHSNYDSATATGTNGTVTPAGSGTNQTAAPMLVNPAAGDFHQLAASPTIGAGLNAAENGITDIDGDRRRLGFFTDIGADEAQVPPGVATGDAAEVTVSGARLSAVVNPAGSPATAHFEWGTAPGSLTNATPDQGLGSGFDDVPVAVDVTGLPSGSPIYFRAVASNSTGSASGAVRSFTTAPAPPDGGGAGTGAGGTADGGSTESAGSGGGTDVVAPVAGLRIAAQRLRDVLRRGLAIRLSCSEACRASVELLLDRRTARRLGLASQRSRTVSIGRGSTTLAAAGSTQRRVRLTRRARSRLRRTRSVTVTVRLTATDAAGNTSRRTAKVTIRR